MAIDKIKRILFTLICIVLVASAGVIAYAAWDDVQGKKTNDLTTTTGTNTTLIVTDTKYHNADKYLVPYNTVNYTDDLTRANPTNYMAWKINPVLSDPAKLDPMTGKVLAILYSSLTIEVKNNKGEVVASTDSTLGKVHPNTIFTYGLSATAPTAAVGAQVVIGTVIEPGTTETSKLTSGTDYYFTIRFKDTISANNVPYSGCTISITINLEAIGL